MRARALVVATLLAWAGLPAMALVASADEGPRTPPVAGPPLRPPLSVLRPTATASAATVGTAESTAAGTRRDVIVLVGGYASGEEQHVFDDFEARIARHGGYEVLRFGRDFGRYDTLGPVDENALRLRDGIRSLSGGYGAVHIVTHSMGGVVTDRAFAAGLSRADGVTTYVAWAAPHDGSSVARALQATLDASGGARDETRAFTTSLFRDPDTAAVRDLARLRAARPPEGVARLDLRLATDLLVSGRDAQDAGVDSRVLLPATLSDLEGHGGILRSDEAFDLTIATIRAGAAPPDERGAVLREGARVVSSAVDDHARLLLAGVCGLCLIGGVCTLVRRTLRQTLPWPPLIA